MDDVGVIDAYAYYRGTETMVTVLMSGPLATSGGVSTHTKNIVACLEQQGVQIIFSNQWNGDRYDHQEGSLITKFYQRTIGLAKKCITYRKRIDLIHIQASGGIFAFIPAITGVIISKSLNKPLIVTFHHSETERFVNKYMRSFKFVLKYSDRFILVSNRQKDYVSAQFDQFKQKIVVIPNGYVSSVYYPRDSQKCRELLNLPKDSKILFNISNLLEVKGQKFLISALSKISDSREDILCFIAGKGPLKESLGHHINELGIENKVKLIGWLSDEEVPIWINAANIFVLPSLAEGNPIVMFECLGCGKPFIGTKVGGVPEIITSDKYGLLVQPANPEDLVEKILLALDREWDREAILRYAKQYTWDNIAKETIGVYEQVLGRGLYE